MARPVVTSLKALARAGIGWASAGVFIQGAGQIAVLVLLARTLTPEEFGIANAALLLFAIGANLFEDGVGLNIAQRKDLSEKDVTAASQISIMLSIGMCATLFLARDPLAHFFNAPGLAAALSIIAWTFLLGGLIGPQEALLFHRRRYKTVTAIKVSAFVGGYSLVSIVLALQGVGYMSLIYGHFATYLITAILMFLVVGLPCAGRPNLSVLREHLVATALFSGGRIATYIANQSDKLVIGRILGMDALGFYGRAHQIMMIPNKVFMQAVTRVATPLFSSVQDDRRRVGAAYIRSLSLALNVILPFVALVLVFRDELVRLLLGEGWEVVSDLLAILALAGLFHVLYKLPLMVLYAQRLSGNSALSQSIFATSLLLGALAAVHIGMEAVAWVVVVITAGNYIALTTQVALRLSIPAGALLRAHAKGAVPGLLFLILAFSMRGALLDVLSWLPLLLVAVAAAGATSAIAMRGFLR